MMDAVRERLADTVGGGGGGSGIKKLPYPISPQGYNLQALIGKEPKATIWMGETKETKESVAIKIIDLEGLDSKSLESLKKRLQKNEFAQHPNIVNYLCSFYDGHNLWVVMNYLAGGSCQDIITCAYPNGFEEPTVAIILYQVLIGLEYFHRSGRIHRDLRASRIFLEADGTVRLSDSGVSTIEARKQHQTLAGSPSWTAPEVFSSHGYDSRADIWSFGITALELAQGHPPYANYPPLKRVMLTLESDPPKLEPKYTSRFSDLFHDMVASCLQKDPAQRLTASQLLQHSFFKTVPPKKYLVEKVLSTLPSLEQRFKNQMQSGQIASLTNEPFGWMGPQSPHFQNLDKQAQTDPPTTTHDEPPGTPSFFNNEDGKSPTSPNSITSPEQNPRKSTEFENVDLAALKAEESTGSRIQVGRFKVTTSTVPKKDEDSRPTSIVRINSIASNISSLNASNSGTLSKYLEDATPSIEQQLAQLLQQSQAQQKLLAALVENQQKKESIQPDNPLAMIANLEKVVTKLMKENEELRAEVARLKLQSERLPERSEEERKRDMLAALQNWKVQPHEVIKLVGEGIPDSMRGSVWQLLTQSIELYNMNKNYYEDMKDRESNFAEAITCDAPRTIIAADPSKQKSLANILLVYSIYDLDTGYCQGMNYIVAMLLEFMPEENAFWLFVRLMKSYCIKGFFQQNSSFLLECMEVFDQNLAIHAPKAVEHLKKFNINATLYASKWFTTLFFYPGIPHQLCYRIFDLFCVDGLDILFRAGIALICLAQDSLLSVSGFMELTNHLLNIMASKYPTDMVIRKAHSLQLSIPYLSTSALRKAEEK
eukprot:TRINITY_DN5526_c0_g1_i2.p1 TRINITY_DN5526_c0_g1~~TRINITY_DN5526_c0_g1_i2.p1  ORF type:complete len:825 (+),score=163.96 TRINITY_DN5526_c0_g1_i2:165-2639(+)